MIQIEEMKVNSFQDVRIPSNREYFEKFGMTNTALPHSGDDFAPRDARKIDELARTAAEEQKRVYDEEQAAAQAAAETAAAEAEAKTDEMPAE